jgi:hypothetical protein
VKKQIVFGHIGTLLIGGLIYILFRADSLKMFGWYDNLGVLNFITNLRENLSLVIGDLPNWFLFSLPDGLWIFSYITLMLYIWNNSISKHSVFWIFIIPILTLAFEFGQLFKIVPGTFDIIDIVFYILGIILPIYIFNNSINLKQLTT